VFAQGAPFGVGSPSVRGTLLAASVAAATALLPALAWGETLHVTQTSDHAGTCNHRCALREAVIAANDDSDLDKIRLPRGRYELSIGGPGEDAAAGGDLDVRAPLRILGAGAPSTVIDANHIDRVVNLFGSSGNSLVLKGVTITGGKGQSSYEGAGIMFEGGGTTGRLVRSRVAHNTTAADTSYEGGGIFVQSGADVTLNRTLVKGNVAKTDDGGGILNLGGLRLVNSTVARNAAGNDGGGISSNGSLSIEKSTISGNRAGIDASTGDSDGAGIYVPGGVAAIENSTIAGNAGLLGAGDGGGVYAGGPVGLTYSTVAFNHASDAGGGVYNAGGSASLADTIVAGNQAGTGRNCGGSAVLSGGNNLENANSCGLAGPGDLARAEAGLAHLASNGGPTKTIAIGGHSDAVGAADDSTCPTRDQRGVRRPQGNHCDIGAFERRR
jgi:hypothetical protein